jgi:hypothetical protein
MAVNEGVCEESIMHSLHVIVLVMHAYEHVFEVTTVGLGVASYKTCDEQDQT